MFIEDKSLGLSGPARIGRVRFSQSGRSLYYRGRTFQRVQGYTFNHVDVETGEEFWISGPRQDGADRLYGEGKPIEIDHDVREEYWSHIRRRPERRRDEVIWPAGGGTYHRRMAS